MTSRWRYFLVAPLFLGSVALSAPAAHAATTECKTTTTRPLAIPNKPDVTVKVRICVTFEESAGRYRWYKAWVNNVSWDGSSFYTGGKRVNTAFVRVRLEHNNVSKDHADEYVTSQINGSESGSYAGFYDSAGIRTTSMKWTADGKLYADVADDGKGYITRELNGTATVR